MQHEPFDLWAWLSRPWATRKHTHDILERRDAARRRHTIEADLDRREPTYKACMHTIAAFYDAHGNDAVRLFAEGQVDGTDHGIDEVDQCRSVVKDYFRAARSLVVDHECVSDPERLVRLRREHAQFVRHVEPLDDTHDRKPGEGVVFKGPSRSFF